MSRGMDKVESDRKAVCLRGQGFISVCLVECVKVKAESVEERCKMKESFVCGGV